MFSDSVRAFTTKINYFGIIRDTLMYEQFSALIFDMDGTLVDSGQLHEQAWIKTLQHYAIPVDRPLMRSLSGVSTKATIELLLEKFNVQTQASATEIQHFKELRVQETISLLVKPTALQDIVKHYYGKKPMAVGTGAATEEAKAILAACGLANYFTVVVGADQVLQPKPAPDVFLRCAELLKETPERCVVFEDAKLGLQAAASAGMVAVDVLAVHNIVNDYFL